MSVHERTPTAVRIIGCGRWLRGDDQIGLMIAQALRSALEGDDVSSPLVAVESTEAPSADLFVEGLGCNGLLVVIDAARVTEGVTPGTWTRIDYLRDAQRVRDKCRTHTHALSVDAALEMAAALELLPRHVWIYAVAGEDFGYHEHLSAGLAKALPEITARIRADVAVWLREVSS
jgi:hydrogenase maturation protease